MLVTTFLQRYLHSPNSDVGTVSSTIFIYELCMDAKEIRKAVKQRKPVDIEALCDGIENLTMAMPPLAIDFESERIENKPSVLHRGKLTFNLATIDRPHGKPSVSYRG